MERGQTEKRENALEVYLADYAQVSSEMQTRINLQNLMTQRALSLTVLAGTVASAGIGYCLKEVPSEFRIDSCFSVALIILVLHSLFTQMTLANWIYQLSVYLQLFRYTKFLAVRRIQPLLPEGQKVLECGFMLGVEWATPLDSKVVRFFQPLATYLNCGISFLGLVGLFFWYPSTDWGGSLKTVMFVIFPCLLATLIFLIVVHFKLHSANGANIGKIYSKEKAPSPERQEEA